MQRLKEREDAKMPPVEEEKHPEAVDMSVDQGEALLAEEAPKLAH